MPDLTPKYRIVLVTGPSGAGRSTAINAFEDVGFEAIDNIPLGLVPRLFDGETVDRPLALGIDIRNRDFSMPAMLELYAKLTDTYDGEVSLLYLDCRPDVLLRRYSETRRRHPLTPDDTPEQGIHLELALLKPLEEQADIKIDTSSLSPHELKAELHRWFVDASSQKLSVTIQSFSYKRGLPNGADMVFDCRFLANPHWEPALRDKTGLDAEVAEYLQKDARLVPFESQVCDMMSFLLPEYDREGKTHFTIGVGCTGGQHRSVVVTEHIAAALADAGWHVSIAHRELARRDSAPTIGDTVRADASGKAVQ